MSEREPTNAEIETFLSLLQKEFYTAMSPHVARFILLHYEPRTREQRCNRSGYLYGRVLMGDPGPVRQRCPGCVNCQELQDGGLARKGESTTESDARTAQAAAPVAPITSGILNTLVEQAAVEQKAWRLGYEQGRREGEARGKRTIAIDERTLRGLMAAILTLNEWSYSPNAADAADVILAEIDRAKEGSK